MKRIYLGRSRKIKNIEDRKNMRIIFMENLKGMNER
jgi:hypothetical protein